MNHAPLVGKTYSLEDANGSSDAYYRRIREIADRFSGARSLPELLGFVQRTGRNKRLLKKLSGDATDHSLESALLGVLRENFSSYTTNVQHHLRELSILRRWDRTLAMTEPQYHLSLMEIELTNRLNTTPFRQCTTKLAFLPHCLRDLTADCHSTVRGHDYVCKGCSKICTVNAVTKLLRRHGVKPYIWMTANLKSLFRGLRSEGERVGVFGIACVPELAKGMRMCMDAGVPVVGVPLDANRCRRWWGEFHPNAVNTAAIERLLGSETLLAPAGMKSPSHTKTDQ